MPGGKRKDPTFEGEALRRRDGAFSRAPMIGCLVLVGLLISAALGGRAGALVYFLLLALYFGLRNLSERWEGGSSSFGGYESREDWLRAKKMEGRIAWGVAVVAGVALAAYLFAR